MSEIEHTEIVEAIVTVAPETTHEEIIDRNSLFHNSENEAISEISENNENNVNVENSETAIDTNEIEPLPEQEVFVQSSSTTESVETMSSNESTSQKKRRRKGKVTDAQEDNNIDEDFANHLDMSCIEGIAAPSVTDAYVLEYIRYASIVSTFELSSSF